MKIVFLDSDTLGDVSFAPIAEKGELILYPRSTPQQAIERVKDCEVLIVNKIIVNKELVDASPKLRLICEAATGVNNIDIEYARSKGIPVRNAAGYSTESVAQVTFMHILNLVGHASYFDRRVKTGEYYENGIFSDMSWPFFELKGKKLGIHAYGNVGRNVARIAKGIGMDIYAYDAYCPKEVMEADGIKALDSAEELYATCDIVSLHIPATPETKNSINYALVNRLPKNGILVNTARKEVINEAELIQLMDERADLKYITDIMPVANEIFAAKFPGRYFSTPKKMGAQTAEANINAGIAAARQIVGFLRDGCEKFRVNK